MYVFQYSYYSCIIDARHMYIPDGIHILILLLSCISLAAGSGPAIINRLGGSLLAGGFLALVICLAGEALAGAT